MTTTYNVFTGEAIEEDSEYRKLAHILLGEDLNEAPLPLPSTSSEPPPRNPGDLTNADEQRLAAKVCQLITGMDAGGWKQLTEDQRIPWLQEAMDRTQEPEDRRGADEADDSGWLRQADVARKLNTNKTRVARLVRAGTLKTNGKTGHDCRIDPASILAYCERERVAWNDL